MAPADGYSDNLRSNASTIGKSVVSTAAAAALVASVVPLSPSNVAVAGSRAATDSGDLSNAIQQETKSLLEMLEDEISEAETAVSEAKAVVDAKAIEKQTASTERDEAQATYNTAQAKVDEISSTITEAEGTLAEAVSAAQETIKEIQDQAQEAYDNAKEALTEAEQKYTDALEVQKQAQGTYNEARDAYYGALGVEDSDALIAAEDALEEAQAAVNETQTAYDDAVAAYDTAQANYDAAVSEQSTAETALNEVSATLSNAESTLSNAQSAYDTVSANTEATEDEIAAAAAALSDAQAAYDSASAAYSEAEATYNTKSDAVSEAQSELEAAQSTKDDAEAALNTAQQALEDAQDAYDAAGGDTLDEFDELYAALEEAEANLTEANTALEEAETALAEAQTALEEAQALVDSGVIDYDTEYAKGVAGFWAWIGEDEIAKLIEDIPNGSFGDNAASDANNDEYDLTSTAVAGNLDNFSTALDIIEMCNKYRDRVGLDELEISAYLMALSIAATDWYDNWSASDDDASKHQILEDVFSDSSLSSVSENIESNSSYTNGDLDDFDYWIGVEAAFTSWYNEWAEIFDTAVWELYGVAVAGADVYNFYYSHEDEIKDWLIEHDYISTDPYTNDPYSIEDYLNIINPNFKYTGAGCSINYGETLIDGEVFRGGSGVYDQIFIEDSSQLIGGTYKVSELRDLYNQYLEYISSGSTVDAETAAEMLEEAQAAYATAESEYNAAAAKQSEAQTAYDEAKAAYDSAVAALNTEPTVYAQIALLSTDADDDIPPFGIRSGMPGLISTVPTRPLTTSKMNMTRLQKILMMLNIVSSLLMTSTPKRFMTMVVLMMNTRTLVSSILL